MRSKGPDCLRVAGPNRRWCRRHLVRQGTGPGPRDRRHSTQQPGRNAPKRRGGPRLVGDDSIAKSSTVPSSSETAIAELGMPCLSPPADPQDILDLGLHGIAMSRASGLWVAVKLATNVVDGSGTVRLDPARVRPVAPDTSFDGEFFRARTDGTPAAAHPQ